MAIPLFANVTITTARSTASALTGASPAPTTYLQDIQAYIEQKEDVTFRIPPSAGALLSVYQLHVDISVDVQTGDLLTKIAWNDTSIFFDATQTPNEQFRITFVHDTPKGILAIRVCEVAHIHGGGQTVP